MVAQFKLQSESKVTMRRRDEDWTKPETRKKVTLAS
jgi:hypothetical protein